MEIRQYGRKIQGVSYLERPGAYALIVNDKNEVAMLVDVDGKYHLPGGGIQDNESPQEAVKREAVEEVALNIIIKKELGSAKQYCYSSVLDKHINKICMYFLVRDFWASDKCVIAEHDVLWINIDQAEALLEHESHSWGVKQARKAITTKCT